MPSWPCSAGRACCRRAPATRWWPVDRLLGLDTERESCHLVVTLSTMDDSAVPAGTAPAAGIPYRCSATEGFRTDAISADEFGAMLTAAVAGYASDLPGTAEHVAHTVPYVAVNRVRGLAPGGDRHGPAPRPRPTGLARDPPPPP